MLGRIGGGVVAGICLLAELAAAGPALPRTTVFPVYALPADAKADGDLSKWRGVPGISGEKFKPFDNAETITPEEGFAPAVYLGRRQGSDDLFFLIVVKDDRISSQDSGNWVYGDCLELYLDFGRERRGKAEPEWFKDTKKWNNAPEMCQVGFLPRSLIFAPKVYPNHVRPWKMDYESVPVKGGLIYEIRIDGASVLADLKLDKLPAEVGFDVGVMDADYPLILEGAGWMNRGGIYRLFGDFTCHMMPNAYGGMATEAKAVPPQDVMEPPAETLPAVFGKNLDAEGLRHALAKRTGAELADAVYWAGCCGTKLDAGLVEALMASDSSRVRENCLAVLLYSAHDAALVEKAVKLAHAEPGKLTAQGLTCANLLTEKLGLEQGNALVDLLGHEDLTVATTAARALASVGKAEDAGAAEASYAAALKAAEANASDKVRPAVYRTFIRPPLDELKFRTSPLTLPKVTQARTVQAKNVDLPRLMPVDGNNVYDGTSLARSWPMEGPKELWRRRVGMGNSGVVEAGGKAFILADEDMDQVLIAMNPMTGANLWKRQLTDKEGRYVAVTPVVDGDRVYAFSEGGGTFCLRADNGEIVWKNEGYQCGTFAVPLVVEDTLYIAGAGNGLIAVDKNDGKLKWKTPGSASPASPIYQVLDGIGQVIVAVGGGPGAELWGVNAKTGEVFWKYPIRSDYGLCSSPVAVGSRAYLSSGKPGQEFFICLQMIVEDGKIKCGPMYSRGDVQANYANTTAVWQGAVYGFSSAGIECTDASNGRAIWRSKEKWGYDDQLIVADGLIFATARNGDVVLVEATKEGYRETGRVATKIRPNPQQPTIANGRLYVRGESWVVCYDVTGK